MEKSARWAVFVLAGGIAVAVWLGRYSFTGDGRASYALDRWTGVVQWCTPVDGCRPIGKLQP